MALRQGSPPYVCFYSNKCDWSEAFLKELKQTPYVREFQFVCVDTTPRAQLPTWLKQVPTLLIRDDQQEPIKTNSEVMNWLFARKLQDGSRGGGGANIGGGGPAAMSGPGGGGGEPDAWNVSEMGGKLSDSYGVILDGNSATVASSSSGNWDFGFLNGNAATGSRTASDIGQGPPQEGGQKKSKKQELMDKEYEQFMANRDRGMPQMRRPMPGGGAPGGNNGQMPLR